MRYLLDANIISNLIRFPDGLAMQRMEHFGGSVVCTSVIVAAELRFGAAKRGSAQLKARIEGALSRMPVLSWKPPADAAYADIRAHLERTGRPIGGNDLFIAAHALALDCVLVTDNMAEFERVPGLRCENWLR